MKIGFIGLGIMGRPMCMNLIRAGHDLVIYARKPEIAAAMESAGARSAGSAKEAARLCEAVITMLPNSPQVRQVALGTDGICEGAHEGLALIDMSSIDPVESRAIADALAKKGIDMLDAPVSGGEKGAIEATLSVMAGGRKDIFDKYKDVLADMAASVVYVGEIGSGNVAKLANQIIVAGNLAALSEAMTLAVKLGTDPELVYQAIRGGLAGSAIMEAKAPAMMDRDLKPGFRTGLHIKDLDNALNAGHTVSASLPVTALVMEILQAVKADGYGDDDHSSIIRFYEKISDVTVERKNS